MSTEQPQSRRRSRAAMARRGWVDILWDLLVTPRVVGGLLLLAGIGIMGSPWGRLPKRIAPQWWEWAFQSAESLQVVVLLLTAALPLAIGVWLRSKDAATGADVVLCQAPEREHDGLSMASKAPFFGILLMGIGALGALGLWLSIQQDVPPTRAAFSVGEKEEYVMARVGGRPVRMMLPRRVEVTDLRWDDKPGASVEFSKPGQQDVSAQPVELGQSVEVGGKRFTFVGIQEDPEALRAVIASNRPNTIPVVTRKGEKFKVSLDGEEFRLIDMEINYIGVMGPAVQVQREGEGNAPFWVFMRRPGKGFGDALPHGLTLDRLETAPAAVFTVAPVMPFEPLIAFVGCFVLGLGMLLTFPGVQRRGKRGLTSLNEAGALAQSYALVSDDMAGTHHDEEE